MDLVGTSKSDPLITHDEAATRIEAVQQELGTENMPTSSTGWPRSEHQLSGSVNLSDLHQLGFAVDFNAYETPMLDKDVALRDLVQIVTGAPPQLRADAAWHTQGHYDAKMAGDVAQKSVMPEPDPKSRLAEQLAKVDAESDKAYARSEQFRHSLDVPATKDSAGVDAAKRLTELASRLHKYQASVRNKKPDPYLWGETEDAELQQLIGRWTQHVKADLAKEWIALLKLGFDLPLPDTDALAAEEKAIGAASAAASSMRSKLKPGPLDKARRRDVEQHAGKLRALLRRPAEPALAELADAAVLAELDALTQAAQQRLGGYGSARWSLRLGRLLAALGNPSWVLGTSLDRKASDPPPLQLVRLGFYTLKPTTGSPSVAFDTPFVRAMVKHGFTHGGTWGTPDFMHFELRWTGPRFGPPRAAPAPAPAPAAPPTPPGAAAPAKPQTAASAKP